MAGGITDIGNYAGGTALGGTTSGVTGVASGGGFWGAAAGALLSSGGGSKKPQGGGGGDYAASGMGDFFVRNDNSPIIGSKAIDLNDPLQVAVLAVAVIGGIYIYKKVRK